MLMAMPKAAPVSSARSPTTWLQFLTEISSGLLTWTNRDKLDYRSDWHAYEADDDAGEPLLKWERGSVRKITQELYYYDLEYDSAT